METEDLCKHFKEVRESTELKCGHWAFQEEGSDSAKAPGGVCGLLEKQDRDGWVEHREQGNSRNATPRRDSGWIM